MQQAETPADPKKPAPEGTPQQPPTGASRVVLPPKTTGKSIGVPVGEAAGSPAIQPSVPMRTLLSKFADNFCGQLEPVCAPLAKLEQLIAALPAGHALHSVLPELRDVRHHTDVLLEKVRQQHAYVIIFGPLKSGKSTLMNAICASYVSEVTSLPAYPSLVHISYAEKPLFKAVRYDGTTQTFDNQEALHKAIDSAYVELTGKLREIESRGEKFDPVKHMPAAFRKIEIGLATPELADSKAVLVDTPGLYSRMKFGYDQMTRDFRNTAACAIFVVKSDNLFLEQVFDEFNELLKLFSRIFLIVNLDTRKQDLDPQGKLVPSLESKDPRKIIDAFRNLSMSAPIKAATDDGRLCIYPVDLLSAASERIRSGQPGAMKPGETPPVPGFETLRKDLISYLNSSDYLTEFLTDSVRRAMALTKGVRQTLQKRAFTEVKTEIDDLARQKESLSREQNALGNLQRVDWNAAVGTLRTEFGFEAETLQKQMRQSSESGIHELVDAWWQSDASLAELKDTLLTPHLERLAQQTVGQLYSFMEGRAAERVAGFDVGDSLAEDLRTLKMDLPGMAANVMAEIRPDASRIPAESGVGPMSIPVKRRFLDWVLFRSVRRVRCDFFGPEDDPSLPVPAASKANRIGESGRQAILDQCRDDFAAIWNEDTLKLPEQMIGAYAKGVSDRMATVLGQLDGTNKEAMARTEKALVDCQAVIREASTVFDVVAKAHQSLEKSRPALPFQHAGASAPPARPATPAARPSASPAKR